MPSEEEVREAVNIVKDVETRGIEQSDYCYKDIKKAMATLSTVAQSVLDCKGWPAEKEARYIDSPDAMQYNNERYIRTEGFNEALHLCKLAAAKERLDKEEK